MSEIRPDQTPPEPSAAAKASSEPASDVPKSASLKGLGGVVKGAATDAVIGKSKVASAAKKSISTAKDLTGPSVQKENGVDQVVGDVTNIAVSAAKGAAAGAVAGGVGAVPGAVKSGLMAAAKTKSGRRLLIVTALGAFLPTLFGIGVIIALVIGMMPATSAGAEYRNASLTAAASSGVEADTIAVLNSTAGAANVRWEWLAGIYIAQKSESGGEGPFGIDLDAAKNYVDKANAADSAAKLTVISKADAGDLMKSSAWVAQILAHMSAHDQGLRGLSDQTPDAAAIPLNNGESGKLREEPTEKNAKNLSDAQAHEKAWVGALRNLPLESTLNNAKQVYSHARIIALGGAATSEDECSIMPLADGKWTDPVVAKITSGFGPRADPTGTGLAGGHLGTDLTNGKNEPFYSASSGTVKSAFKGPSEGDGGNGIIIDAGGGIEIWYWHAVDNSAKVKAGDKVKAGQQLGTMGTTGLSTGIHLHFEVHVNGTPVDAVPFMKQRGIDLGVTPVGTSGTSTGGSDGGDMTPQTAAPTGPASTPTTSSTSSAPAPTQNSSTPSGPLTFTDPTTGAKITLNDAQKKNASAIIGSAEKVAGAGKDGAVIAIMVAMQESTLRNLANPSNVPESVSLPNDGNGGDHDSVGLFQQRPSTGWGTVKELMTVDYSTRAFLGGSKGPNNGEPPGLLDISGWKSLPKGVAAQKTQRSAFPDAYDKWEKAAQMIVGSVNGTYTPSGCTGATDEGNSAAVDLEGFDQSPISSVRQKILSAAASEVGTPYVWGGTSPDTGWDCSGYVQWSYKQAKKDVPRTSQWTAGKATSKPKPGDLMAQSPSGPGMWEHVAIYAGMKNGVPYAFHALNPTQGTILVPVSAVFDGKASYFNLLGD